MPTLLRRSPRLTLAALAAVGLALAVAVTADASESTMNRAREAGFDGFIGKPLDPDRFPDQIKKILGGEAVWSLA